MWGEGRDLVLFYQSWTKWIQLNKTVTFTLHCFKISSTTYIFWKETNQIPNSKIVAIFLAHEDSLQKILSENVDWFLPKILKYGGEILKHSDVDLNILLYF